MLIFENIFGFPSQVCDQERLQLKSLDIIQVYGCLATEAAGLRPEVCRKEFILVVLV